MEKDITDKLVYALMECLLQNNSEDFDINSKLDNMCITSYEFAVSVLEELGYVKSKNGRMYYFTNKGKNFYKEFRL